LRENSELQGTSLNQLSKTYLGFAINKFGQTEDWSQNPLPQSLIQYAAIDALVSRLVAEELLYRMRHVGTPGDDYVLEEPKQLKIGENVHIFMRGEIVANGVVTFLGGAGNTKQWGKKKIGLGRVLVDRTDVLLPTTKPPILYVASKGYGSWSSNTTLGDIMSKTVPADIAVNTSSLLISLSCETNEREGSDRHFLEAINMDDTAVQGTIGVLNEDIYLTIADEGNGDDEVEIDNVCSRGKEDLWHTFDRLPLPRDCPVKPLIYQLLIHGTWDFVKEDIAAVKEFLRNKDPPINNLIKHFYFNCEWCKQRLRMYTPKASIHAANVRRVHCFVAENSVTKPFYSTEVAEYFNSFAQKCEEGKYEELYDVSLFWHIGLDSAGLYLWLRLRGTVRDENLHQKMKTCLGPFGIGPRSAHYILVNLCYRYNVAARIRRCGDIDHGHPFLNFVDRIQIRTQEIFNVLLFPRHRNISQTKYNNFIAVGIGPLCYSQDFVVQGDPLPELKGDIFFIAKQMNLKCPPLPIVTQEEKILYNKLIQGTPKPIERDYCDFAKEYLKHADGIKIFPKLPSMLKQYYKTWHKNQQVKAAQLAAGNNYIELLSSLSSIRVDAALLDIPKSSATEATPENNNSTICDGVLFVPSVAGPHQVNYKSAKQQEQTQRRCYWWPYCGTVDLCGGWSREKCKNYNKGDFDAITIEQLESKKNSALNEIRRMKRQKTSTRGGG